MTQRYQFLARRVHGAPGGSDWAVACNIVCLASGLSRASADALAHLLNSTCDNFAATEPTP